MKFARWSLCLVASLVLSMTFSLASAQRAVAGERGKPAAIRYRIQVKDLVGIKAGNLALMIVSPMSALSKPIAAMVNISW